MPLLFRLLLHSPTPDCYHHHHHHHDHHDCCCHRAKVWGPRNIRVALVEILDFLLAELPNDSKRSRHRPACRLQQAEKLLQKRPFLQLSSEFLKMLPKCNCTQRCIACFWQGLCLAGQRAYLRDVC